MKEIQEIIKGKSISDTRSAFYYLGRYLKQAEDFENYEKDIFIEVDNSEPNELIKSLTMELIGIIELKANKKSSQFNDNEYITWMNIINEIEDNLDQIPSDEIIKKAEFEIEKFKTPNKQE